MFTALTFNMQNGQAWDDAAPDNDTVDIAATAAFLRSQDVDILFLQEVERGHDGGHQVEPPPHYTMLRELLPEYDGIFGYPVPNPTEIPFGLGLAILSRTPIDNAFRRDLDPAAVTFDFNGTPRTPSHRLILGGETVLGQRRLRLVNTHLQAFFMIHASSDDHPAQRDAVEREITSSPLPTVLAGDFNCAPHESLVEQFANAGFHSAQTQTITWKRMPFVLDHIFLNAPLRVLSCDVVPTDTSDHHAVRVGLDFAR
jgi:endonuclease/exonuclease/phosphatase family metal-dependent hydrolase